MAKLEGQSIASSYEQLLHVDRDGGGNGTTLVDIKDGKNDNTFALQLATDKAQINGVLTIDANATDGTALTIDSEAQDGQGIYMDVSQQTSGYGIIINDVGTSRTTGGVLYINSNQNNSGTRKLVEIKNIHTGATGTTALHIQQDSTAPALVAMGNVGIGNATPSSFESSANDLVIGSTTGDNGITIVTGNTSKGKIHFADGTTGAESYSGFLLYDHNGDAGFQFGVAATTRLKIDGDSRISLSNNDASDFNTIFGHTAFNVGSDATSDNNVVIGHASMGAGTLSGANHNVAIGANAFNDATTGDNNVVIGSSAMYNATTASNNVTLGYSAMGSGTVTGDENVAIGKDSLYDITSASGVVAIGTESAYNITSGSESVAIGKQALYTATTVGANTAVGFQALRFNAVANNTAVGHSAGYNTTGTLNTYVGVSAGYGASGADASNVGVGASALSAITSGTSNTVIGASAGDAITTMTDTVLIGRNAGSSLNHTDANGTTIVGRDAGEQLVSAIGTTLVGNRAGTVMTGSYNTAVGDYALSSGTGFNQNTALGYGSGKYLGGDGGTNASSLNTCIGAYTMGGGNQSSPSSNTANQNTAIGHGVLGGGTGSSTNITATKNVGVGYAVMNTVTTAINNSILGYTAGLAITSGNQNSALGANSLKAITSGLGNTAIGFNAGQATIDSNYGVYVGWGAGASGDIANDGQIAIGYKSLYSLTSGSDNLSIGNQALVSLTNGARNVAIGYGAMLDTSGAGDNVGIGYQVLKDGSTSEQNVAVGNYALGANSASALAGNANVAVGYKALYVQQGTGAANTMVGYQAGDGITTGSQNTGIGSDVAFDVDADNQTAIGFQATTDSANDIAIGNTSVDEVKGQVDFSTFSDKRIKKDVVDNDLGLDFINLLKSRKFKRVNPNEYPDDIRKPLDGKDKEGNKFEWTDAQANKVWDGLIAQEVKEAMDKCGTTFSGWNEEKNSKQLITYSTMVMPLIKAVQELSAKVEELESKLK